MRLGDVDAVRENRDGGNDVLDEGTPRGFPPPPCQQCTHAKLSDRDGRNRDIIVVVDHVVELIAGPLGVDEEGGVEQQTSHDRSSTSTRALTSSRSFAQSASGRWRRNSFFTSAPSPRFIGSRWAIALPRRTIVNCSPRCSMASRRSAKFRAASVAVMSGMNSDYQIELVGRARNSSTSSVTRGATPSTCERSRPGSREHRGRTDRS